MGTDRLHFDRSLVAERYVYAVYKNTLLSDYPIYGESEL